MSNNFDKQYLDLLKDILENGQKKSDRTGTGTLSVFGRQIRHKMSGGFPAVTTKKLHFKGVVSELLWFLNGRTDLRYLLEHNNFIWVGDAYQSYCKRYWELDERDKIEYGSSYYNHETNEYEFETYSKEEFVDYIKTDDEFAKKWGELGPIYGRQWRNWGGYTNELQQTTSYGGSFGGPTHIEYGNIVENEVTGIDQIAEVIHKLKTNPDDRGIIVSAWSVSDLPDMTLRPCHNFFQFYTRELSLEERNKWAWDKWGITCEMESVLDEQEVPKRAISLMFNMRSTDVGLGLSFNVASYSLLLMMIAKQVNMVPDELIYNGGDVHLYLNHIEPIKEQLTREPYPLPTVKISDRVVSDISEYTLDDIILENYQSHPSIKMPLSN